MHRSMVFPSALSTLVLVGIASGSLVAQNVPADSQASQAAPIVHAYAQNAGPAPDYSAGPRGMRMPAYRQPRQIIDLHPVAGVWLRAEAGGKLTTVSADSRKAEFRLEHGRLNLTVHHPENHAEILVDLPGGQTTILKDGLYTFNADNNTIRVLYGEAAAYPGPAKTSSKPVKIKENHQLAFISNSNDLKSIEAYPYELEADLLPFGNRDERGYQGYGQGDGDAEFGPYDYPYYAGGWGYPGFWGYPYGYSFGVGYYGGFGHGFGGFRR